jgi:hypothetical protein
MPHSRPKLVLKIRQVYVNKDTIADVTLGLSKEN